MKKKVLLSVFAASVFAAAPAALAVDSSTTHNGTDAKPGYFFGPNEKELGPGVAADLVKDQEASTKAKFGKDNLVPKKDENGNVIPGEFVVKGNAAAKKAMPAKAGKAGHRALPKTSAAK